MPEVKDFQLGPSSEVESIYPIQTGGFLTDCYLTSVHVIEPNLRFELANIWKIKLHWLKLVKKTCFRIILFFLFRFKEAKKYLDDSLIIFWKHNKSRIKDNVCFQKSIFQWQIKLISYWSEFWHLRRKSAVIFSKLLFFQNSLVISWAK